MPGRGVPRFLRALTRRIPLHAFLVSFGVIFVAELGDKSQLMALAFASRYRPWPILVGITLATGVVHAVSVLVGGLMGAAMPTEAINLVAGVAFLGFAVWTLRGDKLDDEEAARADRTTRSVVLAVAVAFFLAELGDKTMLATITLATREGLLGTWVGSTLGMVAADALAIGVGAMLGRRLPERTIRIGAAASFVLFGILLIFEGLA
jgi:putative Ca2+/H+ antiporter (TMEM165/GDT1 family)